MFVHLLRVEVGDQEANVIALKSNTKEIQKTEIRKRDDLQDHLLPFPIVLLSI